MEKNKYEWPIFSGDYIVNSFEGYIGVATLNDDPEDYRELLNHKSVSIIGSVKTENLGIEKIIANVISNPNIRYLVICGAESKGHFPGQALIALLKNGVDEENRIIGAKGAIPYLENVGSDAVMRFRDQILRVIEKIGTRDVAELERVVNELEAEKPERYPGPPLIIKGIGKKERTSRKKIIDKIDKLVLDAVATVDPLTMRVTITA